MAAAPVTNQPVGNGQPPPPVMGGHPPAGVAPGVVFVQHQHQQPVLMERDWSTGLFACTEDMGICACGAFCSWCLACRVARALGEHCCITWCPGGMLAARARIRTQYGISGTICVDCLLLNYCGSCALCQMARELKAMGRM